MITNLAGEVVSLWQTIRGRRPLTEADMVKLTPKEIHDYGLCNKARLHYECRGRNNYSECG